MASPSRRPQTPTVTRIQSGHKDRMKSELRSSVPPPSAQFVFLCGGASGKSAKRRRWRKKRAGFEEVPRLAATTVDGNRLARRWARELRPYAGVESAMHVGGGVWSPRPTGSRKCNGVWGGTMWVSPPTGVWHGGAVVDGGTRGCRPTDIYVLLCRGGRLCPPVFSMQQRRRAG